MSTPPRHHSAMVKWSDRAAMEYTTTGTWLTFSRKPDRETARQIRELGGRYRRDYKSWYFDRQLLERELSFVFDGSGNEHRSGLPKHDIIATGPQKGKEFYWYDSSGAQLVVSRDDTAQADRWWSATLYPTLDAAMAERGDWWHETFPTRNTALISGLERLTATRH